MGIIACFTTLPRSVLLSASTRCLFAGGIQNAICEILRHFTCLVPCVVAGMPLSATVSIELIHAEYETAMCSFSKHAEGHNKNEGREEKKKADR